MDDFESSIQSLPDLRILKYGMRMVLRGDDKQLVVQADSTVLDLTCTAVPVGPDLDVVSQHRVALVQIIHDDHRLLLVAIKPLVAPLGEVCTIGDSHLPSLPRLPYA